LVRDTLGPKPTLSRTLLGVGGEDGREPQKVAVDLLQMLSNLLRHASLGSKISQSFESGDSEVQSQVHTLFSRILEQTLGLADYVREMKPVSKACDDTLGSLLGRLSLVDFFDTIELLLKRPNDDLRRKILRLLEGRLEQSHERGGLSQDRALGFLSTLIDILDNFPDIRLKHAAVACIERISDKYGKKDPVKIVAAAKVVSGEHCIGQTGDRIRIMGLLCLASMTETLGQAVIPVIPQALSQSFRVLHASMEPGKKSPQVHDAVYSLVSALLIHVPWMISESHLDNIVRLSFRSANANLSEGSDENRRETLQLLSKKVDVKEVFDAIDRNWPSAVSEGPKVR
jgi:U3 small nucleolar RNA-associated protein 10